MSILDYFVRANLFLALFYACYWLLLRQHTFFMLNRIYLLMSATGALVLPFVELPQKTVETVALPMAVATLPGIIIRPETQSWLSLEVVGWGLYGVLLVLLLSRLIARLVGLMRFIRESEQQPMDGYTFVWPKDADTPTFSFFRYLVLNPSDAHAEPVHRHELVHIRQLHSIDVLFFEVLQAIFWLNPILILYKRSIRQVHEFLADREAANDQYENYLVAYAFGLGTTESVVGENIAHSFLKASELKERIAMLRRRATSQWALSKYLMVLPLALGLLAMTTARHELSAILPANNAVETILKGQVTDSEGKTLAGASIILKGTTTGTQSDANGLYRLTVTTLPANAALVISYVGYETLVVPINGRTEINVSLQRAKTTLNEVVVVGYPQTGQWRSTNPTNQTSSSSNEIFTIVEQVPAFPGGLTALGQYLAQNLRYPAEARQNGIQGAVIVEFVVAKTGGIRDLRVIKGIGGGCDEEAVRVVSQMPNWNPGRQNGQFVDVKYVLPVRFTLEGTIAQQSVSIRKTGDSIVVKSSPAPVGGSSLLDSDRKPLYVVDGVAKDDKYDLKTLNPNDIESISVLKGASATSVYGEKGINGVIIIRTKSGKKNEKPK